MLNSLIDKEIDIIANEYVEKNLLATIIMFSEDERKLLLKMDTPLNHGGIIYPYAIAATRLEGDSYTMLVNDGLIGCSITWVSKNRFDRDNPFNLSWWRGGASTISSIKLKVSN